MQNFKFYTKIFYTFQKTLETFNFIHIMAACIIYSGHGHKHLDIKIISANARNIFKIKLPSNLCMQIFVGL